jgi:hypothetical protein
MIAGIHPRIGRFAAQPFTKLNEALGVSPVPVKHPTFAQ